LRDRRPRVCHAPPRSGHAVPRPRGAAERLLLRVPRLSGPRPLPPRAEPLGAHRRRPVVGDPFRARSIRAQGCNAFACAGTPWRGVVGRATPFQGVPPTWHTPRTPGRANPFRITAHPTFATPHRASASYDVRETASVHCAVCGGSNMYHVRKSAERGHFNHG